MLSTVSRAATPPGKVGTLADSNRGMLPVLSRQKLVVTAGPPGTSGVVDVNPAVVVVFPPGQDVPAPTAIEAVEETRLFGDRATVFDCSAANVMPIVTATAEPITATALAIAIVCLVIMDTSPLNCLLIVGASKNALHVQTSNISIQIGPIASGPFEIYLLVYDITPTLGNSVI